MATVTARPPGNGPAVTGFTRYDDSNFRWAFNPESDLLHSTVCKVTISRLVADRFGGNAMGAREVHAHWTGSRLFVWSNDENGGYFYDPATDSWNAIDSFGGPSARSGAASAWTGGSFVLWGGQDPSGFQETGFVFTE